MKNRRKRKSHPKDYSSHLLRDKKKYQLYHGTDRTIQIEKIKKQIENIHKAMDTCIGPENILRFKVLKSQENALQQQIEDLETQKQEKEMNQYLAIMDKIEKMPTQEKEGPPTIPLDNRILPPKAQKKNLFDIMAGRDGDKWKLMRMYRKRCAMLFDMEHPPCRNNPVDQCEKCKVNRHVDKETAISVCPKCGATQEFASHIFETKDVEKDDSNATKQQSLSHMQKFSAQFERGYPNTPIEVLEQMANAYQKIHLHDPAKVQPCKTSHMLKNLSVPKVFKRAPDRLTMELKRVSIPEYSTQELSSLLNQRNRLRTHDDNSDEQKHKKSCSNSSYMRQLGRANKMEPSRLFYNAKTCKIHMERTRSMESECEDMREKIGNQPGMNWSLYPAS